MFGCVAWVLRMVWGGVDGSFGVRNSAFVCVSTRRA